MARIPQTPKDGQPVAHNGLSLPMEAILGRATRRPEPGVHRSQVGSDRIRKGKYTSLTGSCFQWWMMSFFVSSPAQMSAEQLGQLYELMHATKDVWKPVSELQEDADAAEVKHES
jgi:hypothetical protein